MEIRYAVHPEQAKTMDTATLREHFLVKNLFLPDQLKLVYSFNDRLIIGGACPITPLPLEVDQKIIGSDFFLQRRELGVINVGGPGVISVDGEKFAIAPKDGLYIGMGAKEIVFASTSAEQPAKFYFNSVPAHATYPTTLARFADASPVQLGEAATGNRRTIRKYIHPAGIKSCQLVMGMTSLETGSVWNTMPTHTHERRMEAYFYFEMNAEQAVFHLMGPPDETRHVIMRNEEAVISPSWSIHSGVGTANYTFIWGMAGENQLFDDMDHVAMKDLR
ncbi:5-dehydro-4-deoxy-D-glucuronate isomerase [Pelobacter seleniigenes]|uniref:5-dehydro-4-deoxy-D-glucuronate isomerase n=1 Tax=Pelobacter seleniigenes TaxID=407188 RepID=UPI0004A6D1C8|nr:5-dehydro-4-deoxy-D-glucuronate isomerase [Pelobacter seleniigenes]